VSVREKKKEKIKKNTLGEPVALAPGQLF